MGTLAEDPPYAETSPPRGIGTDSIVKLSLVDGSAVVAGIGIEGGIDDGIEGGIDDGIDGGIDGGIDDGIDGGIDGGIVVDDGIDSELVKSVEGFN